MRPFAEQIARLDTIPGIDQRGAEALIAEIGTQMSRFPSAAHLASWARMCPGNDESAGKRRSGRTGKGNRWLRPALTQAAWAAQRKRGTSLAGQYRRLARRRGKKRALVAVGHALLGIVYHVLKRGTVYQELGEDYLERQDPERLRHQLVQRLEAMGLKVTIEAAPAGG